MRVPRLHSEPGQVAHHFPIKLSSDQCHYLERVLRLSSGSKVHWFTGEGSVYEVRLESGQLHDPKELAWPADPKLSLTLAVAVAKGSRFEDMLESLVELGVDCIQLLETERTEVKPSPQKLKRWQKVMAHAAQLAGRTRLSVLKEPLSISELVQHYNSIEHKAFWDRRCPAFSSLPIGLATALFTIGPEGGFSDNERQLLLEAGFQGYTMSSKNLRVTTAAIVAAGLALKVS